jgi:hypothetical protein
VNKDLLRVQYEPARVSLETILESVGKHEELKAAVVPTPKNLR